MARLLPIALAFSLLAALPSPARAQDGAEGAERLRLARERWAGMAPEDRSRERVEQTAQGPRRPRRRAALYGEAAAIEGLFQPDHGLLVVLRRNGQRNVLFPAVGEKSRKLADRHGEADEEKTESDAERRGKPEERYG